jgi:hypothetical protein
MRPADALSRHVSYVTEVPPLSLDIIRDEQKRDKWSQNYEGHDNFYLDKYFR